MIAVNTVKVTEQTRIHLERDRLMEGQMDRQGKINIPLNNYIACVWVGNIIRL